jgi:hypothetical protein
MGLGGCGALLGFGLAITGRVDVVIDGGETLPAPEVEDDALGSVDRFRESSALWSSLEPQAATPKNTVPKTICRTVGRNFWWSMGASSEPLAR